MKIWDQVKECPAEALKIIPAGKLKGKSDINPMWRYEKLTELFGPAGDGWGVRDDVYTILDGANGEKAVMCHLILWWKNEAGHICSVPGQGGSMLVNTERDRLVTNDEAYKMAYTDAISVACKQMGFAANVYWQKSDSKYMVNQTDDDPLGTGRKPSGKCEICGVSMTAAQITYSQRKLGRLICPDCQVKEEQHVK